MPALPSLGCGCSQFHEPTAGVLLEERVFAVLGNTESCRSLEKWVQILLVSVLEQ